jgi:hypothetical protein
MARRTAKSGSPKAKDEPKNCKSSVELHDRQEGKSIAEGARVLREINEGQQQRARSSHSIKPARRGRTHKNLIR